MTIERKLEAIGVVAVVVSLIFLGYELNRANSIAEAEASAQIIGGANELLSQFLADERLFEIWNKGSTDFDSLSEIEKDMFFTQFNYALNVFEVMVVYEKNGLVDEGYRDYYARDMCRFIFANEGTRYIWSIDREFRAGRLVDFIDTNCEQAESG